MDEKEILRRQIDESIREKINNQKVDTNLVEQQIRKLADLENERYVKTNKV